LRKLKIFFITLICLLASNVAFTLGVGDIEVKSALSEPLNAEIKLFSVRPGEGENIRVSLATLKEFTAAGIDRPLILSYLKFKVVEKGDGNAYIQVYSKQPIREPFLDFLVDIDWPSGRLLREYTLLLDPPIFAQRKATVVEAPAVAAPTRIIREQRAPEPAPTAIATSPVSSAPVAGGEDDLFPRIQIDEAPALELDSPKPEISVTAYNGDTYKVKKNQTLWSIAASVRPDDSISMSQMMIALQNANPDAFSDNNINALKSGFVLRVPDRAEIESIDQGEALRNSLEQNELWRAAQDNLSSSATPSGTTTTTSASSKVVSAPKQQEPTVKLVTPDSKTGAAQGSGADSKAAAAKLALANEQLASKAKENDELQGRVKSLEDQIGSMERLLELKEDSLSELQNKLTDAAKQAPPAPPVAEKTPEPAVVEKAPEPAKPAVKPTVPDASKVNPYALDETPKVTVPKPVAPKPKPATPKPAEPSLFDDPVVLAAMIAVVLAILAIIWLVMQRRRNNMQQFPESILSSKPAASTSTSTANDETNLLSDFAPSAMDGALESDSSEVDPSAEADVYIAYGKHQQAEELLLTSLESEPERLDLKLKLMEVYHAMGNADSFLKHAEQLNASMDDQNTALWDKAVVMGRELCPGNELFGAVANETEDDFSDLEGIGELDDDLDLELNVDEALDVSEPEVQADDSDELSLDMDLDSLDTSTEDDDLSLEIDDLSLDMEELTDEAADAGDTAATEDAGVDFGELSIDLDEDTVDVESTSEETSAEPTDDSLELDVEDALAAADDTGTGEVDDAMLGMDEVATKLDLAKAYIDMGDPDGARAILDEVLTEGNDDQQSEAKGLIDQL